MPQPIPLTEETVADPGPPLIEKLPATIDEHNTFSENVTVTWLLAQFSVAVSRVGGVAS